MILLEGPLANVHDQPGWVARAVLVMLFCFSLFSWALIFQKSSRFGRLRSQTELFLRVFRSNTGMPDPRSIGHTGSPLEVVYAAGYRELELQVKAAGPNHRIVSPNSVTAAMQLAS